MKSSPAVGKRAASGSPCNSRASTPARKRVGFERSSRITRGGELRNIARTGKRLRIEHLDVRVVASLSRLRHARIGLVVPRHGRSAVDRNSLKRRLRELSRTILLPDAPPIDVVLHARPSAYALTFAQLQAIIVRMRRQLERLAARIVSAQPGLTAGPASPSGPTPSV